MNRTYFLPSLLLATLALALSACSGGAATTANGNVQGGVSAASYAGPAPISADVQAFKVNLWAEHQRRQPLRQLPQGGRAEPDVRARR